MSESNYISIKGAKVNNLKNIDVNIPRNKLVVITGLSGSGKSSLAFDTLYAEGQRRYVESLSSYARQFLGRMSKPECDFIKGIPPAIAIEQKVNSRNPRSTVGTSTEIYEYLRLLYARVGKTYSPISGQLVKKHLVIRFYEFNSVGLEFSAEREQLRTSVSRVEAEEAIPVSLVHGRFGRIGEAADTVFAIIGCHAIYQQIDVLFFIFGSCLLQKIFYTDYFTVHLYTGKSLFQVHFQLLEQFTAFTGHHRSENRVFRSFR